MAAGQMRVRGMVSLQSGQGTFSVPFDYAAAMDELFPPVSIEVVDGATDQALIVLGTGGLTIIQGLFLTSSVAVSVKLGAAGSNVAIALAANAPLLLMGCSLTAVSITNASGETAIITYTCSGT